MTDVIDDIMDGETISEYNERKEQERIAAEEKLLDRLEAQAMGVSYTKFEPSFIRIMLRHMGIEGKSYKSLALKLGIRSTKTLYNWEKKHPEWKAAKEIAESGRLNHVEDTLQKLASGKYKGNAAAAIFYAKNACPDEFKDKREIDVSGGVTYVIDTGIPAKEIPQAIHKTIEAEFEEISPMGHLIDDESDDSDLL